MGHYRCVQISFKPIEAEDVKYYSVDVDMLGEHPGADYHGYEDMHDALDVLKEAFGESITSHTDKYIVVSRDKLGKIIEDKYNKWKHKVMAMNLDDSLYKHDYVTMNAEQYLSNGELYHEDDYFGYPVCSWHLLTSIYKYEMDNRKTLRIYYGASIDFHS